MGIGWYDCAIQNYAAVSNDHSWANDALFANLDIRSNFHGLNDGALVDKNMTADFDRNVSDLIVLLLEWRFDDDAFVQYDITTDEYFGQIGSENNFLLQDCMIVDFDIIRALDETLFTDEIFGFSFEVVFVGVKDFFVENVVFWVGMLGLRLRGLGCLFLFRFSDELLVTHVIVF